MYLLSYSLHYDHIYRRFYRFNKYSQICARALRQSLKEGERVKAEKRGLTALRYQNWENGQGSEQVFFSYFYVYMNSMVLKLYQVYLNPPDDFVEAKKSA